MRYVSIRPDDAPVRAAMKAVASERRRFGYRRTHIMLERQGIVMNQKKLRRLYREEKLQVRRRGGRKRALGTRYDSRTVRMGSQATDSILRNIWDRTGLIASPGNLAAVGLLPTSMSHHDVW